MAREFFAHPAGICDLCVLDNINADNNRSLITVGVDGSIRMFNRKNPAASYTNSYSCSDAVTCITASSSVYIFYLVYMFF